MELLECLMSLGFTRHESQLYIVLCREGELTGYEASKISGINRSNAYLALAGLVDKGGAFRIDSDAAKYVAVSPGELGQNIMRRTRQSIEFIQENIPMKELSNEPFYTIEGRSNIIDKMKTVISGAKERVYISISPTDALLVNSELVSARERGLKLVIITAQPYSISSATIHYHSKMASSSHVRLIADTEHVLTGRLGSGQSCNCLYSKNIHLVEVIKDSLTNEIKIINMEEQS